MGISLVPSVKNSTILSTGTGNYDGVNAVGVNYLYVVNNQISSVGDSSSAIQFVGCHNSVISQNTITNTGLGGLGVSTRGGSSDVIIHGNTFENMTASGAKAVQLGGNTSLAFFKPPLVDSTTDPLAENFEAARIIALSNIINNVDTPLVYDGCIDCVFANNTVTDPLAFIVRILQSTLSDATFTFAETQNGEFLNNIVIYSTTNITSQNQVVNIGANTLPATFTFDHTLWWATNEAANYTTTLPAPIPPETASLYQLDPLFTTSVQIDSNSPVLGQGSESVTGAIGLDYGHAAYARPPAIGAYEGP